MNMTRSAVAIALSAVFSSAALAQAPAVWDQRDARQAQRIERGVQSGQITPREAARLEQSGARIDRMQSRASRDGVITSQERARIENAQDRQSRAIYRQSHDRQTSGSHHPQTTHGGPRYGDFHADHRNEGTRNASGHQYGPHGMRSDAGRHANPERHMTHGGPRHGDSHGNHRNDGASNAGGHQYGQHGMRGGAGRHAYPERHMTHGAPSADAGQRVAGRLRAENARPVTVTPVTVTPAIVQRQDTRIVAAADNRQVRAVRTERQDGTRGN